MPPEPTRIVLRAARDVADHDRSRGAGDAAHVVMLGQPVALIAPAFGVPGEVERVAQGVGCGRPFDDGREVEGREGNHGGILFRP